MTCKYASSPDQSWERDYKGNLVPIKNAKRDLCTWAHYHPDSANKLGTVPPWLVRNALAGHLMQPGDCEFCPLYDPGDPIE